MPVATAVHLPRSLTWRSSNGRPTKSNKHNSSPHGSQGHCPISFPLLPDTPLPSVPASMQHRQPLSKKSHKHIKRSQISGPIQLLSTTNSLAYTSPDLKTMGMGIDVGLGVSSSTRTDMQSAAFVPPPSSGLSRTMSIPEETSLMSDTFSNGPGSVDSPLTSPSVAYSIEQDQKFASDHASSASYFDHDHHSMARSVRSHHGNDQFSDLHRQRGGARSACEVSHPPQSGLPVSSSASCIGSQARSYCQPSTSAVARPRVASSSTSHSQAKESGLYSNNERGGERPNVSASSPQLLASSAANDQHPFSRELAQVEEVAEEFGKGLAPMHSPGSPREEDSADDRFLQSKGLKAFRASDYLTEIEDYHVSPYQTSNPYASGDNVESDGFF